MGLFSKQTTPASRKPSILDASFENLPTPYKTVKKGELDSNSLFSTLKNLNRYPDRLVQESASLLSRLNRMQIKTSKRVELLKGTVDITYPLLAALFEKYQGEVNNLPERSERKTAIVACINFVEQAAIAYRHIFREEYSESGFQRQADELLVYAMRILEFIRLEQLLRALRYQKLSAAAWKDANRVFFLMAKHKAFDIPVRMIGRIGYREKHAQSRAMDSTIRKVYLSLQLYGLLDIGTWPTRLFHVPLDYFDYLEEPMRVKSDSGAELAAGWLVTYMANPGPALFKRNPNVTKPSICIDYSPLYNTLAADYENLAKMKFISTFDALKISPPLRALNEDDREPVLEMMLVKLRMRERKQKRHAVFSNETLRIYFGFKDAYKLLLDIGEDDDSFTREERRFSDTLAQSSALLSEDDNRYMSMHWNVVNFSTGGMLVNTEESDFTNPIKIGQLIAFFPSKETKWPMLGYVTRIHRPREKQVEVAIVRLTNSVETAAIQNEKESGSGTGRPVFLSQNPDLKWSLIAQQRDQLVPGTPIKLTRADGSKRPARLGDVVMTQQEFIVYGVSSPNL